MSHVILAKWQIYLLDKTLKHWVATRPQFCFIQLETFLMHLVLPYSAIIPLNAWTTQLNDDKELGMRSNTFHFKANIVGFFNCNLAIKNKWIVECKWVNPLSQSREAIKEQEKKQYCIFQTNNRLLSTN